MRSAAVGYFFRLWISRDKFICRKNYYGILLIFLGACAHSLKDKSDLALTPQDFDQKIEAIPEADYKSVEIDYTAVKKPEKQVDETVELRKMLGKVSLETPSKTKKAKQVTKKEPATPALDSKQWVPVGWPFGIGEKITLVLRYGPLEGGIATLEVNEPQSVNGDMVLHYRGTVKSSKVLDLFYKVNDEMDSWVGISDHLPRRQEIKQLESSHWGKRVVVFNQKNQHARYFAHTTYKDGHEEDIRREDEMTPFAQDVLGALFFYRFAPDLKRINFPVHDRFRNWANELTYLGTETIQVPAGEFETIHYKMFPRVSGELAPKGDVDFWVKNDSSRVVVQFKAKIKVGSITGELKEYVPGVPPKLAPPLMKTPCDMASQTASK